MPADSPIEKRFCVACNVDQPIRAKHCRKCGFCLATHDHHCFWLGNFIGEKNRPLFFVFLNVQSLHLFLTLARSLLLMCAVDASFFDVMRKVPLLCLLIVAYSVLFLGVTSLLGWHYYFILTNITTCKAEG